MTKLTKSLSTLVLLAALPLIAAACGGDSSSACNTSAGNLSYLSISAQPSATTTTSTTSGTATTSASGNKAISSVYSCSSGSSTGSDGTSDNFLGSTSK